MSWNEADGRRRGDRRLVLIVTLIACVPLLVAVVRAIADGWYPAGDNAYFSLRGRDVLTSHHPLLGTWTSASVSADRTLNNPGPLLFDMLALPAKIDHRYGVAAGAVLVNLSATVGCVLAGWWTGGRRVALMAAAMAAALGWVLGSGLLVDPWQPHNLLLPALAGLMLTWGVVAGRTILWPWLVGAGSLLVQTHLPYAFLIGGMLVLGIVATWRNGALVLPRWRPGAARHLLLALVVGVVLWAQPLVDQVAGQGNLGALASSTTSTGDTTGWSYGGRLAATVLAAPGLWGRADFAPAFIPAPLQAPGVAGPEVTLQEVPTGPAAAVGLLLLVAVLGIGGWLAHRRRDGEARAGIVTAAVAVAFTLVTTANVPIGALGLGPHQLRFLWPVGVFVTGTVALAVAGRWRGGPVVAAAATVVFALLGLPAHPAEVGPSSETTAIAVLDELAPQLAATLDPDLTYFVESEGSRLFEPYTTPLMLELQAHGAEFTVDYVYTVPQVGERRREDGQSDRTLAVVEGPGALDPPPGQELVASVEGLDAEGRQELDRLREEVLADLEERGVVLSDDGARAARLGLLPSLKPGAPPPDPEALVATGQLGTMVRRGYLELDPDTADTYRQWADLQQRWSTGTVGVWMGPPPDGP